MLSGEFKSLVEEFGDRAMQRYSDAHPHRLSIDQFVSIAGAIVVVEVFLKGQFRDGDSHAHALRTGKFSLVDSAKRVMIGCSGG